LFGADKQIGKRIFKTDWDAYQQIVNKALKDGKGY